MSFIGARTGVGALRRLIAPLRRLDRSESGAASVEFAMVATPFFMLIFGIFGIGIYQFTAFSLQNAVDQASRSLRTGSYQTSGQNGGVMTNTEFKNAVCALSPPFIDCQNKLKIFITQPGATFTSANTNRPSCSNAAAAGTSSVSAPRSTITLVVACYTMDMAATLPYLVLGTSAGQAAVIQASTVFKTEP